MSSESCKLPRGGSQEEQSTVWSPQPSLIWSLLTLNPELFCWICFFRERLSHSPRGNGISLHITVLYLPETSGCFTHETIVQESTGKTFGSHQNPAHPSPSLFGVPGCCRISWAFEMIPLCLFFFWGFGGLCTVLLISTSLLLLICFHISFIRWDHAVSQTVDMRRLWE